MCVLAYYRRLKILLEVMLHVELFGFAMQGDFGLNGRECMG